MSDETKVATPVSNRETKTLTLPSGTLVEVLTYITEKEKRWIEEILFNKDNKITDNVGFETVYGMLDRRIQKIVVSINGSKENVLETFMDMRASDTDAIKEHISEITGEKKIIDSLTQKSN